MMLPLRAPFAPAQSEAKGSNLLAGGEIASAQACPELAKERLAMTVDRNAQAHTGKTWQVWKFRFFPVNT